jgi:hypothetical protein
VWVRLASGTDLARTDMRRLEGALGVVVGGGAKLIRLSCVKKQTLFEPGDWLQAKRRLVLRGRLLLGGEFYCRARWVVLNPEGWGC